MCMYYNIIHAHVIGITNRVISCAFTGYVVLCVDVCICLYACRERGTCFSPMWFNDLSQLLLSVVDTFHSNNTAHDRHHYNHK